MMRRSLWLLRVLLPFLLFACQLTDADMLMDSLAAFVDINGIAGDMGSILDLTKQIGTNHTNYQPFDDSFPLSKMEMGLLFQVYDKCGTDKSLALRTWCTGTATEDTRLLGQTLCPRGVRTHPCTGRVLGRVYEDVEVEGAAQDVVEYKWPWQGIKCDAFTDPTTVTNIYLPGQGLTCRLQDLDFSYMVSLEQLDMSDNELVGPFPTWLGNMTVLRFLNLHQNQLHSKLPLSFGDNVAIEVVDLGRNRLTAASLSLFKTFKRLRYLDLSGNLFNLSLPEGFFSGDYIEYINLSSNAFHGVLPTLPSLKHLTALDVSHNAFEGHLPPDMSVWGRSDPDDPEDKPLLRELDFSHNRFSGTIPPIANLTALQRLAVQHNQLGGLLPVLPPSLIKSDAPQFFTGNDFLCPLPRHLTPKPGDYGNLTCLCRNGRTRVRPRGTKQQPHNELSDRIPASRAHVACAVCPRGSYSNATTEHKCTPCPLGHVTNMSGSEREGASKCVACGPGTFSNTTGGTACLKCPVGTVTDQSGQSTCMKCYPGEYIHLEGSTACKMCRLGSAASRDGSSKCTPCRAGTFAASQGEIACLPCPRGQYQSREGATMCHQCPVGHIAPHPGHKACRPCRAGTFYESNERKCVKCSPNTFTDADAQTQCRPCADDEAAEGFGNSQCEPRTPEGFGRQRISPEVKECSPGLFNDGSFVTCQPCPLGSFAANSRSTQCTKCTPGSFGAVTGATQCTLSPPGSHVAAEGAQEPTRCAPRYYADTAGSVHCQPCPPETASLMGGRPHCEPLEDGDIFQNVKWPQAETTLVGVRAEEMLTNTTLVEELRHAWHEALVANGVSRVEVHVWDVVKAGPSTAIARVALEFVPPPRPQPRASNRDVFTKIKDTYTDVKDTVNNAKDSAAQWMDQLSGKSNDETNDLTRLVHANATDVIPQAAFKTALARQLVHSPSPSLQTAASLVDVSLMSEPFNSTKAMRCPRGFFFSKDPVSLQRSCVACPPGTHGDVEGLVDACKPCPTRHYSDIDGLEKCWECPWGEGALPGSTVCEECGFYSRACGDFWNDVLLTAIAGIAACISLYQRSHEMWNGRRGAQQISEDVALVAAIRTFGRVPWTGAPTHATTMEYADAVDRLVEKRTASSSQSPSATDADASV